MLFRHSAGTYQGNELTCNSSGKASPQSSQLAEPLWIDPAWRVELLLRAHLHFRGEKKTENKLRMGNDSLNPPPTPPAHLPVLEGAPFPCPCFNWQFLLTFPPRLPPIHLPVLCLRVCVSQLYSDLFLSDFTYCFYWSFSVFDFAYVRKYVRMGASWIVLCVCAFGHWFISVSLQTCVYT